MTFLKQYILILGLLAVAQPGFSKEDAKFAHRLVVGFNFGGTTPMPLPAEVRGIDAYWPQFTPQMGYNILYRFASGWGVTSGLLLDLKGMGVKNHVKYMHTNVLLNEDGQTLDGYFVGRNETILKVTYLTLPVYLFFVPGDNWKFKAGAYISYNYSSEFKGSVWDGYLRLNDFRDKMEILEKGEASFNFGGDMSRFDFGLCLGAERKLNDRFGIYGNLAWGMKSIFPSNFNALDYKMYNIYMAIGITYGL